MCAFGRLVRKRYLSHVKKNLFKGWMSKSGRGFMGIGGAPNIKRTEMSETFVDEDEAEDIGVRMPRFLRI